MKLFCLIFAMLTTTWNASAQESISIEDFKKMDSIKRAEIISNAPPVPKVNLERIHVHLMLLEHWGTEEALRRPKESAVSSARGFFNLNRVQSDYQNLWDSYYHIIIDADKKTGMTQPQLTKVAQTIEAEKLAAVMRIKGMHDLVFHLALTPQARILEKRAGILRQSLLPRIIIQNDLKPPSVRKDELAKTGKEMDQLIEQLKQLPTLTQEQVQQEYNEFPEGNML